MVLVTIFEVFLIRHSLHKLPFAPYVPTCQKLLILTFVAWMVYYAVLLSQATRRSVRSRAIEDERSVSPAK